MARARIRTYGAMTALLMPVATSAAPPRDAEWIARGKSEMVAADSEHASKAGLAVLEAGGNAIDAAVAVSFALAVTRPYSTGLGGGGFMIARFADGRIVVQDFRETAPAASTPDMFVKAARPEAPSSSEFGFLAVAVPGLVAGRCQALREWGTMPLEKVVQPALDLARDGFPVDDDYVRVTKEVLQTYEKHPSLKEIGTYVFRTHLNNGALRRAGDKLVQPELARLLDGLAAEGPEFFYRGPIAAEIAKAMRRHGGIVTEADLANYQTKLRDPLISTYRGCTLILMPSPSSGGITIAETLNILENFPTARLYAGAEPDRHVQIEAMKHAFADRARWLGDQDFVPVPTERLLSRAYAANLATLIKNGRVLEINRYGSLEGPRDSGTSHFCVVDRFGNVIVSTETINTSFGSLTAIDEWGLILNNEMDDFSATPNMPNAFGLVQSSANTIAPGKRPLSSMSPTIVLKDDAPVLLLGASGGPRIISSVLNVFLFSMDLGYDMERAMEALRPHHQWQPDTVYFDRDPTPEIVESLHQRGHKLAERHKTGIVQAIRHVEQSTGEKEWVGACDPRKGGKPAGR